MAEVQEKLGNLQQRLFTGRANHGPAFFIADLLVKMGNSAPREAISKKFRCQAINA
jgi:hypothetical protein